MHDVHRDRIAPLYVILLFLVAAGLVISKIAA